MSSPSLPDVSINISVLFSGIYSSSYICTMLLGISIAQTYIYFRNYPEDRILLKLFVVWLLALNSVAQILCIKGLSRPLLKNWANVATLETVIPEFVWQVLTTSLLSSSAQIFFTYRLWLYSNKNILYPLVFVPAALSQLVAGVSIYINGALSTESRDANTLFHGIDFVRAALAGNSIAMGVDILLAALMGYRLLNSRTGIVKTDRMIHTLFIITVNSGLWTAVVAVICLIGYVKLRNIYDYTAIYITLSPLYCNTVLANLNVRDYVRNQGAPETDNLVSVPSRFVAARRPADSHPTQTESTLHPSLANMNVPSSNTTASAATRYSGHPDQMC